MQQLIFDLYPAAPPSFDNFVAGRNGEALAAVRSFVEALSPLSPRGRGAGGEGLKPHPHPHPSLEGAGTLGLFLWGAPGSGKTHLLQAACALASASGFSVHTLGRDESFPLLPELSTPPALWVADNVDSADDDLQAYLFTLYNALKENGGGLLASASVPPARLTLREDLRTRLGWGGIYEIVTLRDEDKLQALSAHADARGLRLPTEIVAYLLKHSRRDMRSLVAVLDALDRYSLSLKRPLTLPLVRGWLSGDRDQGPGIRDRASTPLSSCGKQAPVGFADTPFKKGSGMGGEGDRMKTQRQSPPLQGEGLDRDEASHCASPAQTARNSDGETQP
ncbi:MAG: DnaA/Hda family protein [Proteobacteria bacterium]|nr:DnaA/Hda family protein [Pseudomonadota bacterium]